MPATACGFESRFGHAHAKLFDSAGSPKYCLLTCQVHARRLRLTPNPARPTGPRGLCLSSSQFGHAERLLLNCDVIQRPTPTPIVIPRTIARWIITATIAVCLTAPVIIGEI